LLSWISASDLTAGVTVNVAIMIGTIGAIVAIMAGDMDMEHEVVAM